jgi:hypothetical protein
MSKNFNLVKKGLIAFGVIGIVLMVLMISGTQPSKDQGLKVDSGARFSSVTLPSEISFAGERIPLENFDVRESLDKELLVNTYWHSQTFLLIKRANRFFPEIEPILEKYGIPDDFKYLALAESGLTNAVSPAGAAGIWQFVKPTGIEYGLEINDEVDERYSIQKSTEAACKFLKHSYNLYKSWTMAAASYNMGRTGLNKQIARQQSRNYYDILLNDETSRYVFRIASLKTIVSNPEKYGFIISKEDLYPPYQSKDMHVSVPINDIAQFAFQHGTNYKMIKILNPWLRDNVLTNKYRKTYTIKLPEKGFRVVNIPAEAEIDTVLATAN